MFKKLTVLLLAFLVVLQTMAPTAVALANEYLEDELPTTYEVEYDDDVVEEGDDAQSAYEADEVDADDETKDVEIEPEVEVDFDYEDEDEDIFYGVDEEEVELEEETDLVEEKEEPEAFDSYDWTSEQWDEFWDLIDEYNDASDRVNDLVSKAFDVIFTLDISEALSTELQTLIDRNGDLFWEYFDLMDDVWDEIISFDDAVERLRAIINDFEGLALEFEVALDGLEIPIRFNWTIEEWDIWYDLVAEYVTVEDRIWDLLFKYSVGSVFDLDELRDEFWGVSDEVWNTIVKNSLLPFDEASALLKEAIVALEDLEARIEAVIVIDGWTPEQVNEWLVLLADNFDVRDRVNDLLFFGEGKFDLDDFSDEYWDLVIENWYLAESVRDGQLSFEDAELAILANTAAFEDLANRLEDLGIVVLPPYSDWTEEQIEEWFLLLYASWDLTDRIWLLLMPEGSGDDDFDWNDFDWDVHWEALEAILGSLVDDFLGLELDAHQLWADAFRSRITADEAIVELEIIVASLEELLETMEALLANNDDEDDDDEDLNGDDEDDDEDEDLNSDDEDDDEDLNDDEDDDEDLNGDDEDDDEDLNGDDEDDDEDLNGDDGDDDEDLNGDDGDDDEDLNDDDEDDDEDKNDDATTPPTGGGGNNNLPQTGAVVANTALAGIALVGLGAITTIFKNKKK